MYTVLVDIERRHSIYFQQFQAAHSGHFLQFLSKNIVIMNKKLPKITTVSPKCASWRSNQEWRSISTNTVVKGILASAVVVHVFQTLNYLQSRY